MRWAFWRKEPDPPPRQVTRRVTRKESGIRPPAPQPPPEDEPLPESMDDLALTEEMQPEPKRPSRAPAPPPDPGAGVSSGVTPTGGVPSIGKSSERLGDLLVKSGAISADALEKALDTQRELRADTYLGEILIRENAIDEEKLAETISQQYRIPLIRMDGHEFKKDLLKLLSADDAWRLRAIPTDKLGRILSVAMTNPLDERATAELARLTGLKIKPLIAVGSELRRALDFIYPGRAPSTMPRPRPAPPAARQSTTPLPVARPGVTGGVTGRIVARAPESSSRTPLPSAGANTLMRRANKPAAQPVAPAEPVADRLEAEAVTEEMFEAATSSNPDYILRHVPNAGQRRKATPATPIGDAEFVLFVGSLPRPRA